jgi:cytochrome b561
MNDRHHRYLQAIVLLLSLNLTGLYVILFRVYGGPQFNVLYLHLATGILIAALVLSRVGQ